MQIPMKMKPYPTCIEELFKIDGMHECHNMLLAGTRCYGVVKSLFDHSDKIHIIVAQQLYDDGNMWYKLENGHYYIDKLFEKYEGGIKKLKDLDWEDSSNESSIH